MYIHGFEANIDQSAYHLAAFFLRWFELCQHRDDTTPSKLNELKELIDELREYGQSIKLRPVSPHIQDQLIRRAFSEYREALQGSVCLGRTPTEIGRVLQSPVFECFWEPGRLLADNRPFEELREKSQALQLFSTTPETMEYLALLSLIESFAAGKRYDEVLGIKDLRQLETLTISSDSEQWESYTESLPDQDQIAPQWYQLTNLVASALHDPGFESADLVIRTGGGSLGNIYGRSPTFSLHFEVGKTATTLSVFRHTSHTERYSAYPIDWVRIFSTMAPAFSAACLDRRIAKHRSSPQLRKERVNKFVFPTEWLSNAYPGLRIGAPIESLI